MNIKIKRFDTSLPIPEYKTKGAAAFDLYARETVTIKPHTVALVPLNIAIEIPDTHWALVSARSSLYKMGALLANGIGVGDADFCGDGDEYKAPLLNFTAKPITIEKGDRIVQMMILQREKVTIQEVTHLGNDNRGGIGSTGRK